MGESTPCPYHFSDEEISQHRKDGEELNESQDFWDSLEGKVARSGWTTHEDFNDAVKYFSMLRQAGLETLSGKEREEFEMQTKWVLDHGQMHS